MLRYILNYLLEKYRVDTCLHLLFRAIDFVHVLKVQLQKSVDLLQVVFGELRQQPLSLTALAVAQH